MENLKRARHVASSRHAGWEYRRYEDVALDIKAAEQKCEACTITYTHTQRDPDTHRLISSQELETSFICKTPRAPSPLVNMSCSSGGR